MPACQTSQEIVALVIVGRKKRKYSRKPAINTAIECLVIHQEVLVLALVYCGAEQEEIMFGTARQQRCNSHFLSYIRKQCVGLRSVVQSRRRFCLGQLTSNAVIATSCHTTGSGGCACICGAEEQRELFRRTACQQPCDSHFLSYTRKWWLRIKIIV